MRHAHKKMIFIMIINAYSIMQSQSPADKRKELEAQVHNLIKSIENAVGPIVEKVKAQIAHIQEQIAKLPAKSQPMQTPATPSSSSTIEPVLSPGPIAEPPMRPVERRQPRPLPPTPAPRPPAERPLPPIPTSVPVERPLPPIPTQTTPVPVERPLPPIPTQATERPLPPIPATSPEGKLPSGEELEPLPFPSEEELSQAWVPSFPPMDAQPTTPTTSPTLLEEIRAGKPLRPVDTSVRPSVVEQPQSTQQQMLQEIQKGKQLRPVTPAERKEYRSDIYKLFEGEQAARTFERARQQALEKAQAQTAREEDWQGWE